MNTANNTVKFEVGKTYSTRSIGDHNCIYRITVARRTPKMIVTTDGKKYFPSIYDGAEMIYPNGRYSMAAIIRANDTRDLRPDWEQPAAPKAPAALCRDGGSRHAFLGNPTCTLCGTAAPSLTLVR